VPKQRRGPSEPDTCSLSLRSGLVARLMPRTATTQPSPTPTRHWRCSTSGSLRGSQAVRRLGLRPEPPRLRRRRFACRTPAPAPAGSSPPRRRPTCCTGIGPPQGGTQPARAARGGTGAPCGPADVDILYASCTRPEETRRKSTHSFKRYGSLSACGGLRAQQPLLNPVTRMRARARGLLWGCRPRGDPREHFGHGRHGPRIAASDELSQSCHPVVSVRRVRGLAQYQRRLTREAVEAVARELPQRDDSTLRLIWPADNCCAFAVATGIGVIIDEGDSLTAQPQLLACVKRLVCHQLLLPMGQTAT
jgi:hypothetical protein